MVMRSRCFHVNCGSATTLIVSVSGSVLIFPRLTAKAQIISSIHVALLVVWIIIITIVIIVTS